MLKIVVGCLVAMAVTLITPVTAHSRPRSLRDGIKAGVYDIMARNRQAGLARFFSKNDPDQYVELQGPAFEKWSELLDQTGLDLGHAFRKNWIITFEDKRQPRGGQLVMKAYRFDLGVIFVRFNRAVALDWEAVERWEKAGGFPKLGMPSKDDFKARVKVIPATTTI